MGDAGSRGSCGPGPGSHGNGRGCLATDSWSVAPAGRVAARSTVHQATELPVEKLRSGLSCCHVGADQEPCELLSATEATHISNWWSVDRVEFPGRCRGPARLLSPPFIWLRGAIIRRGTIWLNRCGGDKDPPRDPRGPRLINSYVEGIPISVWMRVLRGILVTQSGNDWSSFGCGCCALHGPII